ncbi:MAG: hypothetical protein FJ280_14105 [Planctomycetes bacterium]|nr:hypothetical protein [Planctomycetota bacterium]
MNELATAGLVLLAFHVVLGYTRPGLAFITGPVSALFLLYAAVVTETLDGVLLAPVLTVVTWGAIAVSGRDRETQQWYHWWAWYFLVTVALLLALVASIVVFHALGAGFILPLFFILSVVVIVAAPLIYAVISRRTMVMHVFSTIGSIMRQNLPLAMALDCAATGREDTPAFIFRRVKGWLIKGYSLTEAVRRGYAECPPRVLAMLAAGERIDQLPAALAVIERDLRANAIERRRLQPVHPFYPVVILAFAFLLILAIMTFVMPVFGAVLQEMMGGRLPVATRMLLAVTEAIFHPRDGQLHLGVLVLLVGGVVLCWLSRRRRPGKPYPHTWVIDSVKWFLPLVHWFERNRSMVQVTELLRLSLDAGCPVNEAIRGTLELDVNVCFRTRLVCWLQRVERGENIAASARRCGLGAALAWAFDSGASSGQGPQTPALAPGNPNTPAVLEMLESHYRSNYSYRVNLMRFILWPLAVVVLGAIVGFMVYAVFSPMVAVLRHLSGQIYP